MKRFWVGILLGVLVGSLISAYTIMVSADIRTEGDNYVVTVFGNEFIYN